MVQGFMNHDTTRRAVVELQYSGEANIVMLEAQPKLPGHEADAACQVLGIALGQLG